MFSVLFSLVEGGGGGVGWDGGWFNLVKMKGHEFNLRENGFNLRPDLTDNISCT